MQVLRRECVKFLFFCIKKDEPEPVWGELLEIPNGCSLSVISRLCLGGESVKRVVGGG